MSVIDFFDSVGRDLRHALRGLSRRPSFASAAVLTLALGIGATTAIFSVVYSVLLKPLPYPNAEELVRIVEDYVRATYGGEPRAPHLDPERRTIAVKAQV